MDFDKNDFVEKQLKIMNLPQNAKNKEPIYIPYFRLQKYYEEEYGEKTVVLAQIGGFFEIYSVYNFRQERVHGPPMNEIVNLLNICKTLKNKSVSHGTRNPYMAGIPIHALNKFLRVLVDNDWTTIIITQDSVKKTQRSIKTISSKGTDLELSSSKPGNNFCCIIYLEKHEDFFGIFSSARNQKTHISCGACMIDITTGEIILHEISDIAHTVREDMTRFIESHNPVEIIQYGDGDYLEKGYRTQKIEDKWADTVAQDYLFSTIFAKYKKELNIFDTLDIATKNFARIALVAGLGYCHRHNPEIIKEMGIPIFWQTEEYMILYNNALYQLNVVGNSKSLVNIIDKTRTSMGSRHLKQLLLSPYFIPDKMQKSWDDIEYLVNSDKIREDIQNELVKILDIQRLCRKMILGRISPYEFTNLINSVQCGVNILQIMNKNKLCRKKKLYQKITDFIANIHEQFDLEKMNVNLDQISENFYRKGIKPDLDQLGEKILKNKEFFTNQIELLNSAIDKGTVKEKYGKESGFFLTTTNPRSRDIEKKFPKKYQFEKATGSEVQITNDEIKKYSRELFVATNKLTPICANYFIEDCKKLYIDELSDLANKIADIDVKISGARCAIDFGYTKPKLQEEQHKNKLFIKDMRHPIIERIHTSEPYIENDVKLENDGIVIFGFNGIGKSSYMKAVGLNLIMAQAGFWAACSSMEFTPFNKIFARISGNDDLYAGDSSFVLEMKELKSIINYADAQSLVLGDEICRGTETNSALSIVSACLDILKEKKCCYVFASHLHRIADLTEINAYHLTADINPETGIIKYERKLNEGIGEKLYGLEVAKGIITETPGFIESAESYRRIVMGIPDDLIGKKCKYNAGVIVRECQMCSNTDNLETHHIVFQANADKNGMIKKGVHKNRKSNLVVLCDKCHDRIHEGEIEISGWKKTSEGLMIE